jgi:hypothetical protein
MVDLLGTYSYSMREEDIRCNNYFPEKLNDLSEAVRFQVSLLSARLRINTT